MTTALTIMRLQPLHNGHKKIIDTMLQENNQVILLIGSINKKDNKNPYSFEKRLKMVKKIYSDAIHSKKLIVRGIKDINNPPKWVDYVKDTVHCPFDIYYCGNGQDGDLFQKKGIKIKQFDRNILPISGTLIRKKIQLHDLSWKQDVPKAIHSLI